MYNKKNVHYSETTEGERTSPQTYRTPLCRKSKPCQILPEATIRVIRVVNITVWNTSRVDMPALSAHHVPLPCRVDSTAYEKIALLSTSRAYLLTDRRICFALSDLSPFSFGCFLSCLAQGLFVEIQTFIHFSHKKCIVSSNAFCTVHPFARLSSGPGAPSPLRVASLRASRNLIPRPFPFLPPRERPFANNTNLLLHLFPAIHDKDALFPLPLRSGPAARARRSLR